MNDVNYPVGRCERRLSDLAVESGRAGSDPKADVPRWNGVAGKPTSTIHLAQSAVHNATKPIAWGWTGSRPVRPHLLDGLGQRHSSHWSTCSHAYTWQPELEARRRVVRSHLDASPMCLGDLAHNIQAQAEAAVKMVKAINCKTEKGKALHGVRVRVPFDFSLR